MPLPRNNKHAEEMRQIMQSVGLPRLFFWFWVFNLPVAIGLFLMPLSIDEGIRLAIACFALTASQMLVYLKLRAIARKH